jgi:hypothetical protein
MLHGTGTIRPPGHQEITTSAEGAIVLRLHTLGQVYLERDGPASPARPPSPGVPRSSRSSFDEPFRTTRRSEFATDVKRFFFTLAQSESTCG